MRKEILLLCVLGTLVGCSANPVRKVESDFVPTTSALVVYSTRVNDKCGAAMSTLRLNFRYQSPGQSDPGAGSVLLQNGLLSSDFEGREGFYKIEEWPAGEYWFIDPTFSNMKIGMASSKGRYDVRFKLAPGKAYYLGEFNADILTCRVLKVGVKDEYERDRAIFDSRMKKVKSSGLTRDALPMGIWPVKNTGL